MSQTAGYDGGGYEPPELDYAAMVQQALLQVPRQALDQVAEHGLPGDHHFFLSFHTHAPGVVVPPGLRSQYPDEMTIVLQHQYWDLAVDDEAFSVTLAFGRQRQHLFVPFSALTAFMDPEAQFALRFELPDALDGEDGADPETPTGPVPVGEGQPFPARATDGATGGDTPAGAARKETKPSKKTGGSPEGGPGGEGGSGGGSPSEDDGAPDDGAPGDSASGDSASGDTTPGDNVVRIDRFKKGKPKD